MEKIIEPVDVSLIKAELTAEKKLQDTHKGGNELYVVTAHDSPNVMLEIGRLREEAFRAEGGSSGLSADIDMYDTMENPYKQLVVWDPESEAIIGGYRYILGTDVRFDGEGLPILATAHMFRFSDSFIHDYLPHTIELGRSFVSCGYQSSKARSKAIFALDNLWDGLTAVIMQHHNMMYFFGKMTMYPSYNRTARDLIMHFLFKHFPDREGLVLPYEAVENQSTPELMDIILKDDDFKSDYRNLKEAVHALGTSIPPLVNSYMNTSPTMRMFGTAVNHEFSEVEETGILVCFNELNEDKRERHVKSYLSGFVKKAKARFPHLDEKELEIQAMEKWFGRRKKLFMKFLQSKGNE